VVDAVRRVHAGEPVFSATDLSRLVRQLRGDGGIGADLTGREREVLQLLAQGATTEALADRLYISKHTARSHVRNILAKLGAHSKLEAVSMALRAGLVTVEPQI
jgi:DNA-binding NarL/FixJ family response regulator